MAKINFVCPKCGSDSGIVAEISITQYCEVKDVYEHSVGEPEVELDRSDLGDGIDYEVESYMCWDCDEFIAWNNSGLLKYLKEHNMLTEDT
jgi:hypothetical protein